MQLTKEQLAIRLRLWINHKRVLAKHSKYYKEPDRAKSLSAVYSLFLLVKRNCAEYNMQQLINMVLVNEKNLRMILPAPGNTSYKTQEEKLEQLITTAKTYHHEFR
jgi:hypothetical protein